MPLKPLPYREIKRRLEAAGFVIVSQNGSHVKFKRLSATAIVPKKSTVTIGTIGSILKQAKITVEEWDLL